ncbi:MAG: 7TM-DISM domain-containing protein, partial [Bacteroidota bacterium]
MKRVLCVFILLFVGSDLWAQKTPIYKLRPETKQDSLGKFLSYYKDSEQKVSIQDILTQADNYSFHKPSSLVPRFGLSEAAFWF